MFLISWGKLFRKCFTLERRVWKKRRQNLGAFLVSLFILLLQAKRASFRQSIPGYFAYYFLDNYCMILSPQRSVQICLRASSTMISVSHNAYNASIYIPFWTLDHASSCRSQAHHQSQSQRERERERRRGEWADIGEKRHTFHWLD